MTLKKYNLAKMKNRREQVNAQIRESISNYSRMGIKIELLEIEDNSARVKIQHKRLINNYMLNQKQLVERVKDVFKPTGLKTKVVPMVYFIDPQLVDFDWINLKMSEFGIKRNDLIKQLAIDKSSLSLFLNGKRKMNKLVKAAFYYYFLTYELNRDFRAKL
tara:strand:+ start:105 stop:587 length:483 start_codon:yes stop_codon:yes gene_type:complete